MTMRLWVGRVICAIFGHCASEVWGDEEFTYCPRCNRMWLGKEELGE